MNLGRRKQKLIVKGLHDLALSFIVVNPHLLILVHKISPINEGEDPKNLISETSNTGDREKLRFFIECQNRGM